MLTDEPAFDADDAPLPDGELVAAPIPTGTRVTLRFASPFEPWLTLGGRRVTADRGGATRALLVWLGRRQPALLRALELERGLRATLAADGVIVTDLVSLADGVAVDHGGLMSALEGARVRLPTFAVLGASMSTRAELMARVRSLYAAGTPLDVRIEDQRRVLGRRAVRVGRA
jgi:hypothetical protein